MSAQSISLQPINNELSRISYGMLWGEEPYEPVNNSRRVRKYGQWC